MPSQWPSGGVLMGLVCLILAAASPGVSVAQDTVSVFAGGGSDYSTSGYIGGTFALPGSIIQKGWAVRAAGFTGGYQYNDNGEVKASFNGGEIDGLYQLQLANTWADFGLGARYTDTSLSPNTVSSRRKGGKTEFEITTDGGQIDGPWRLDWYGYYGVLLNDYAVRLSATHTLNQRFRVGVEAYVEGDPTYDLERLGPYVGFALDPKTEFQLSAGPDRESGRPGGAYFRISANKSF